MKNQIRTQILEIRNQLDDFFVNNSEKQILNHILNNYDLAQYKTVLVYIDFNNEVKTRELIQYLLDHDHHVLVPKTQKTSNEMDAIRIYSFDDLKIGNYGILEPIGIPSKISPDLVFVPGVAFDRKGNRIGFGKGYYDFYFASLINSPLKIALAYDFQLVSEIPCDAHDIAVDWIVTETQVISCD